MAAVRSGGMALRAATVASLARGCSKRLSCHTPTSTSATTSVSASRWPAIQRPLRSTERRLVAPLVTPPPPLPPGAEDDPVERQRQEEKREVADRVLVE